MRHKIWQIGIILLLILTLWGCNSVKMGSGVEPLPMVESLPLPELPSWIEQISPTGNSEPLSQILIRFKEPLIPLESLDTPAEKTLLNKFAISPPLAGQFRFLTPQMVEFQAEKALPKATRVRITLKSGLKDLKNHQLDQDLAWTFQTEEIALSNLPGLPINSSEEPQPIDLNPILEFTSNVELDPASVTEHLQLISQDKAEKPSLKVTLKPQENSGINPETEFDPSQQNWTYQIIPQVKLKKATDYLWEISPGLLPLRGNLPSSLKLSRQLFTYYPLTFKGMEYYGTPDVGGTYGRFVKGSPQLKFNNGLSAKSVLANITINPSPKPAVKLAQVYDEDNLSS